MKTNRFSKGAGRTALVAVLCALTIILLYVASLAPTGQIGLIALAGLVPAIAVISGGMQTGFFCWGSASLLAFILVPSKWVALSFFLCFGLYPMVKSWAEQRTKLGAILCKFLFANVAGLVTIWIGVNVFFVSIALPDFMGQVSGFGLLLLGWVAFQIVFWCYDLGFSRVIGFYMGRLHNKI